VTFFRFSPKYIKNKNKAWENKKQLNSVHLLARAKKALASLGFF